MASACAPGESTKSNSQNQRSDNNGGGAAADDPTDEPGEQPGEAVFDVERLVSNSAALKAKFIDTKLQNAWGLAAGPAATPTFWWVANNGTNSSTLYDGEGGKQALEVNVSGAPTGLVFNGSASGFVVTSGAASGTARFIFAAEDGTVSAWSPAVPPPPPSKDAHVVFSSAGAIYKGLAIDGDRLFVTDFHNGRVDVLDSDFKKMTLGSDAFKDPGIPAGYAPFGIRALPGMVVVTYAKQDAAAEDDVKGAGFGFVDAYDRDGKFMMRIASNGTLNAPWGIAMAPAGFGSFGGDLLIGNFGDGTIHAYDLSSCSAMGCAAKGALAGDGGKTIKIDGLWALDFGKGNTQTGEEKSLYFTAGPNDEADGLFGYLEQE